MTKIAVEEEAQTPLVVVAGKSKLVVAVRQELQKESVRVVFLEKNTDTLPAWEKADYVFFFGDNKDQWDDLGGRKVIIGDQHWQDVSGRVRIIGKELEDLAWMKSTARKIVAFGFSLERELVVVGKGMEVKKGLTHERVTLEQRLAKLLPHRPRQTDKNLKRKLVLLLLLLFIIAPFLWLFFLTAAGFVKIYAAFKAVKNLDVAPAQNLAAAAAGDFDAAKQMLRLVPFLSPLRFFYFLDLGERSANVIIRVGLLIPQVKEASSAITEKQVAQTRLELALIGDDMGFIEGQLTPLAQTRIFSLLGVDNPREEVSKARKLVVQADRVLAVAGEIVPLKVNQAKTYLVVLQNSAELRPTGGFIGSYALVSLNSGRLSGFRIYDIYTADGQLKGHVQPPDEILHYLGQPSWFMRDANWSPDFPLTAKRLAWFLEKETGISVNGVVGINLGAVQKLLQAIGPVTLPSGETVTAANFFDKAEFAAEINFFPGSEQKPQFLSQVVQAILTKLSAGPEVDWLALAQAGSSMMAQKDVLLFFNSPVAQNLVAENNWSGSIKKSQCEGKQTNCLLVVEANMGANKANYFIKRNWQVDAAVDKGGGIKTTVHIKYRNDSPNNTWPGGDYKNYLRILLPPETKLNSLDLGDGRTATHSPILTADVLKATAADQFLVFKSKEGNYDSYGFLVTVPVQEERMVKFVFEPTARLDFTKTQTSFDFNLIKQPGVSADVVDFALDYPSFLTPVWDEKPERDVSVLALPQKLVYNTDLSVDRIIKVNFKR